MTLKADRTDYALNFLHMYVDEYKLMTFPLETSQRFFQNWLCHWYFCTTDCIGCLEVVDDKPLIIDGDCPLSMNATEVDGFRNAIENFTNKHCLAIGRSDPMVGSHVPLLFKQEMARNTLCQKLINDGNQWKDAARPEGIGRTPLAATLAPITGMHDGTFNMNDIRSIPPPVWGHHLMLSLGSFAMYKLQN